MEKWPGIIAMEFDSEVLVNQAPTLKLANGKTATFMTQYDTKTLLFTIAPEDIGQKVTAIEAGAIESMHNLPVSVVGTKLTNGFNGDKPAIHEVPEFEGGVNGDEAAKNELPEYKVEEKPLVTLVAQQDKTYQAPAAQPQQPTLPATGSEVSTPLVSVGMVGMLLGLFGMAKKKED